MRLSSDQIDEARGEHVIHAALDAGVRLLDTADVYGPTPGDIGHNERLVARAVASWSGPANEVVVATKGGLTRPKGSPRWIPNGRAKHIASACQSSLTNLGTIDLYLLHTTDPKVPMATTVRALAKLKREGFVRRIGLCNVNTTQLLAALEVAEIDAVQVGLSPFESEPIRGGLVELCVERGIWVIAHSPLGGIKRAGRVDRDRTLRDVAQRHGVSPGAAALAWLRDLSPLITPIPGATRLATAADAATQVDLDDTDRAALDAQFPAGRLMRTSRASRRPLPDADGDVVLVIGGPGSGKSTRAQPLVDSGYARLNRDEQGGRLAGLLPKLDALLSSGQRRVVLDNTYPTRASRNEVVELAWAYGVPVRCVWMDVALAEAQRNAVERMIARHGRLLVPDEINKAAKADPNIFGPHAQLKYRDACEPPSIDEGFTEVEHVFQLRPARSGPRRGVILEASVVCASVSGGRVPSSGEDVRIDAVIIDAVQRSLAEGWLVGLTAWRPAPGVIERVCGLLGPTVEPMVCPHPPGPPRCWCRKPLPGLGIALAIAHDLDTRSSVHVGSSASDQGFAERCGFGFATLDEWLS